MYVHRSIGFAVNHYTKEESRNITSYNYKQGIILTIAGL